jgi:membrane-bound transcription factor site-1 protease
MQFDLCLMMPGKGVNVAIFDTGIKQGHPHFRDVKMITDWTDESNPDDVNGHGTFVAGSCLFMSLFWTFIHS